MGFKESRAGQAIRVVRSQKTLLSGLKRLWFVTREVWLYDWARPRVKTGFQSTTESFPADYMWYSPTETSVCKEILNFTKDWIRSYFEYSSRDAFPVFVDFGAGAGKTNLIALELGFPLSIAFELDEDLVDLADKNFIALNKLKQGIGIGLTLRGDATSLDDIKKVRTLIESSIPSGKQTILIAYNKNSYGPDALRNSLSAIDEVFGEYVYLYQNPVHLRILLEKGLNVHRHIQDPGLRKNRDWLIATRD